MTTTAATVYSMNEAQREAAMENCANVEEMLALKRLWDAEWDAYRRTQSTQRQLEEETSKLVKRTKQILKANKKAEEKAAKAVAKIQKANDKTAKKIRKLEQQAAQSETVIEAIKMAGIEIDNADVTAEQHRVMTELLHPVMTKVLSMIEDDRDVKVDSVIEAVLPIVELKYQTETGCVLDQERKALFVEQMQVQFNQLREAYWAAHAEEAEVAEVPVEAEVSAPVVEAAAPEAAAPAPVVESIEDDGETLKVTFNMTPNVDVTLPSVSTSDPAEPTAMAQALAEAKAPRSNKKRGQ